MRKFTSALFGFVLASVLYTVQQVAKKSGAPGPMVDPKNPPAPGPEGLEPNTATGYLYKKTGSFNDALIFVGASALVAIFSYLVIVGRIKRLELTPVEAA